MIYSKKYGRYFNNRSELQRYAWWDARTKPILSWGGIRDCLYSDEYRKEHGLKTREEQAQAYGPAMIVMGVVYFFLGMSMIGNGAVGWGLLGIAVGVWSGWYGIKKVG